MELVFWLSACGVAYPYLGYPVVLWVIAVLRRRQVAGSGTMPTVTLIVPVHNEESRIARKVANTASLQYPAEKLQVVFISDGSTDRTPRLLRETMTSTMTLVELPRRGGKAAALNAGLQVASGEILVFSDASIDLEPHAVLNLVRDFADPGVGCVSGEDRIAGFGGEALYGRYELMLRRLESAVHSIAGASGSFYAQRRSLCQPFVEGLAPDFLSVLRTVEQRSRAVSQPAAVGSMTSVSDPRHEFERKVRTVIRGLTTLFAHSHLLNPFRYGSFAFILASHKVMRWLAPVFLMGVLLAPLALWHSRLAAIAFAAQVVFYLCAFAAFNECGRMHRTLVGRVALYFTSANLAILAAWVQFARGVRQELWTPSAR